MKTKRILVLTSTFPRWINDTTPPFVYDLEKRLSNDFEIHILAPHYKGAMKEEMIDGLYIHRFQYFWPEHLQKLCYEGGILSKLRNNKLLYIQVITFVFFELITTIKLCRKYKCYLVHAHWLIPQGVIAYIINKLLKIPYIITCHGSDLHSVGFKVIKKVILNRAKKITVVSSYLKKEIIQINPDLILKTEIIPMGVDSKKFSPNKYNETIKKRNNIIGSFLLFVGRLAPEKGIQYLIDAIPLVLKKYPNVKLVIIGGGTLEKELKAQVTKLKIESSVLFLGFIKHSELSAYFATADIFISPSINEGLGLTLIEAGMSECSLIGVNSGGIKDIIKNNKMGILLNAPNSKLITKAIIKLIDFPNSLDKKRIRKELIQKFDNTQVYKKYKNIIN